MRFEVYSDFINRFSAATCLQAVQTGQRDLLENRAFQSKNIIFVLLYNSVLDERDQDG